MTNVLSFTRIPTHQDSSFFVRRTFHGLNQPSSERATEDRETSFYVIIIFDSDFDCVNVFVILM